MPPVPAVLPMNLNEEDLKASGLADPSLGGRYVPLEMLWA